MFLWFSCPYKLDDTVPLSEHVLVPGRLQGWADGSRKDYALNMELMHGVDEIGVISQSNFHAALYKSVPCYLLALLQELQVQAIFDILTYLFITFEVNKLGSWFSGEDGLLVLQAGLVAEGDSLTIQQLK